MTYQAILRGKLPSETVRASLEDVLTASVFGAIAYAPPALTRDWLRSVAGVSSPSRHIRFEFWPQHHMANLRLREPDVFIALGRPGAGALLVEAKQNSEPGRTELMEEADAARTTHPGLGLLHLLTVSDAAVAPRALARVVEPVGPFASVSHRSWGDLYRLLDGWQHRPELDAGDRRLVSDALSILRKFNREPFSGMTVEEVRRMEHELPAMYALPDKLQKLHNRLERTLRALDKPLFLNDSERKVSIDGGRAFDRPETWLPRSITLPYGPEPGKRHDRYYFVRVRLDRPTIWIGYSTPRHELKPIQTDAARGAAFVRALHRAGMQMAAGEASTRQPSRILREPTEVSIGALGELVGGSASRIDLVIEHPLARLSDDHADDVIEADLLRVIRLCRRIGGFGAP